MLLLVAPRRRSVVTSSTPSDRGMLAASLYRSVMYCCSTLPAPVCCYSATRDRPVCCYSAIPPIVLLLLRHSRLTSLLLLRYSTNSAATPDQPICCYSAIPRIVLLLLRLSTDRSAATPPLHNRSAAAPALDRSVSLLAASLHQLVCCCASAPLVRTGKIPDYLVNR